MSSGILGSHVPIWAWGGVVLRHVLREYDTRMPRSLGEFDLASTSGCCAFKDKYKAPWSGPVGNQYIYQLEPLSISCLLMIMQQREHR